MSLAYSASVSARRLTLLYKIALGFIALLSIVGLSFFQFMVQRQMGDAFLINIAGRQRMFSQKMSKDALALLVTTDIHEQALYIHDLQTTFVLWQRVHHGLQYGDATLGISTEDNEAVIQQFAALKPYYQALAQGISGVLSVVEQPGWSGRQTAYRAVLTLWVQQVRIQEPAFLQGMNTIVSLYQKEVDDQLEYIMIAGFIFLAIIIAALLVEGYVVFRPALRQLQATLNAHAEVEAALRQSEERYRMVITNVPSAVFALDINGVYTLSEGRGLEALGRQPGQVVGQSIFDVYREIPPVQEAVKRALAGETLTTNITVNKTGSNLTFEVYFTPLYDEQHERIGVMGIATNVSARVQAEELLRRQAWYDAVTGLPNRIQLEMRLDQALQESTATQKCLAVLLLNIARFKDVNDTFGHHEGDQLLKQIGERLQRLFEMPERIAHIGGDEFAVMLPIMSEACAHKMAATIIQAFDEPFLIAEQALQLQVYVGLVLAPTHGDDARTLLRRADIAVTAARKKHMTVVCYDAAYEQESTQRLALMGALRQAITQGQLYFVYQPQADVSTGVIHGVEALVRWQHPAYGMVPPDRFIPLAEQVGLITPLTYWALETAIRQCKMWRDDGRDLIVSVNLSMSDLRDTTLPERIAQLLEQHAVPARLLRVELTESAIMNDTPQALIVLQRIAALGVRISVDDFGTGYSSLAYLKSLPVDELKIDRSFVSHMATVPADAMIVETTIALAHGLGLRVVAEGVEDVKTWHLLADLGCDTLQGYYLSRPLVTRDLESLLARMPRLLDEPSPPVLAL